MPERDGPRFTAAGCLAGAFLLSLPSVPAFFAWRWFGADLSGWLLWADVVTCAALGLLAAAAWLVKK